MALGTMTADPTAKIKIVPTGLSYFHAHMFRSRCVIEFGAPIDVPLELVEMYKRGGVEKREAVTKLMGTITQGLTTVTTAAPDFETLMVCSLTASYTPLLKLGV
jgi:glycerol-3-phosphate O-acyltransferase / dihydroxyacetone phosphate acyltransferase